jgi:hypothetical protein
MGQQQVWASWVKTFGLVGCGWVALVGCTPIQQVRSWLMPESPKASLQLQVQPGTKPGTYDVSGHTDFPNQTELRVAAIRYLLPSKPVGNLRSQPKPTYAVLAYQPVKVVDGQWQASLNLWQVAKDGRYQEAWQLSQLELKLAVKPVPEVVFLATLAPGDETEQVQRLEQQLQQRNTTLDSTLVSSTSDGQRYLRVARQLTVPQPQGRTTPPKLEAKDINGGWGRRYLIPPEPPIPYTLEFPHDRRTNAPAAVGEFLR